MNYEECIYNMTTESGMRVCSCNDKPTPDWCDSRCVDFATPETATKSQLEDATYWKMRINESEKANQGTWKVVSLDFEVPE